MGSVRINFIMLFIFTMLSLKNAAVANPLELNILSISPEANYHVKGGVVGGHNLSNKLAAKSYMWAKKDALSWYQAPPVVIDINVDIDDASSAIQRSGVFSIHTADKPSVGVKAPRRIDVYAVQADKRIQHVGGRTFPPVHGDGESIWLDVELKRLSSHIRVVIHSSGRVTTMDEVRLIMGKQPVNNTNHNYVPDVVEHSYQRLVSSVNLNNEVKKWGEGVNVRFFNFITEQEIDLETAVRLNTVAGEPLYLGVDIDNRDRESHCVDITTELSHVLYSVRIIHSVGGKAVYDPILPMQSCLELRGGDSAKLLIKFIDHAVNPGELASSIKVSANGETLADKAILLRYLDFSSIFPKVCLSVNVWAYSIDKPIWHEPIEALKFMQQKGIDVFVLAPSQLPTFPLEKSKRGYRGSEKFRDALDLFKDVETLLLFAALDKKIEQYNSDKKLKLALNEWLDVVKSELELAGRSYDSWLLYPVDEPRRKSMKQLISVARALDDIDPKIRLYANPLLNKKRFDIYSQSSQLEELKEYVDVWQPEFEFVSSIPSNKYVGAASELWLYQNPSYPPKEESKRFYYDLPLKAMSSDAKGVGFWSASVTDGSSAWVDIDGRRPDWSVFYESSAEPVSSLRWEAFQSGLYDACIYQYFTGDDYDESQLSDIEKSIVGEKLSQIKHMAGEGFLH